MSSCVIFLRLEFEAHCLKDRHNSRREWAANELDPGSHNTSDHSFLVLYLKSYSDSCFAVKGSPEKKASNRADKGRRYKNVAQKNDVLEESSLVD